MPLDHRVNAADRLFFGVAFGVPWICWTILQTLEPQGAIVTGLFLSGNAVSVAGILAAYRSGGRGAVMGLLRKCIRWRVHWGWWLFALLTPLAFGLVAVGTYSVTHDGVGTVAPSELLGFISPTILLGLVLTGPLGEEIGWRGYLLPRLLEDYSTWVAAITIGIVWAVWHAPLYHDTAFRDALTAIEFTTMVVCYSVLLALLYTRTGGSVLLAIVLHWSINATHDVLPRVFPSLPAPGTPTYLGHRTIGIVVVTILAVLVLRPRRRAA